MLRYADFLEGTQSTEFFEFPLKDETVILMDTPGFDDTFRTDIDVLGDIAIKLAATYKGGTKLAGILWLHPITSRRIKHGGLRTLEMFRKLCGSDAMKNVLLVTTFWDEAALNAESAKEREEELLSVPQYWGEMAQHGSQLTQFRNTQESALQILSGIAGKDVKSREALQIQVELVERKLPLAHTAAADVLDQDMQHLLGAHAREVEELKTKLRDLENRLDQMGENNAELKDVVNQQKSNYEDKMEAIRHHQEVLNHDRRLEMRKQDQEWDLRMKRLQRASEAKDKKNDERFESLDQKIGRLSANQGRQFPRSLT